MSRFISSAFTGSTTDPVIANSTSRVVVASRTRASGRCSPRLACWSTKRAVCPCTATCRAVCRSRTSSTRRWLAGDSGPVREITSTCQVAAPSGRGRATAAAPGRRRTSVASAATCGPLGCGALTASVIGDPRWGGKSRSSASETWRAVASLGSTSASKPVNATRRNGRPSTISTAAAAMATRPGRRITPRDSRYQNPSCARRASRSAARRQRLGDRAFARGPSSASSAGRATSASVAATAATIIPPIPIEYRNRCGNTNSEASAAITVSEEKATVRPAVTIVRRSAS